MNAYKEHAHVLRVARDQGVEPLGPNDVHWVDDYDAALEAAIKLCEAMPEVEKLLDAAESLCASQSYCDWRDSAHVVMVKVDTLRWALQRLREALQP